MGLKLWAAIDESLKDYTGFCDDEEIKNAHWDRALKFKDLDDLAEQLWPESPTNKGRREATAAAALAAANGSKEKSKPPPAAVEPGSLERLALCAHGHWVGAIAYFGLDSNKVVAFNNVESFHEQLHKIGLATQPDATIILASCVVGYMDNGLILMSKLSRMWPGRTIVAFNSYLEHNSLDHGISGQYVEGWGRRTCALPGANSGVNWRDANIDEVTGSDLPDFMRAPSRGFGSLGSENADEKSPYAWVVKDGTLISRPTKSINVPEFIVKKIEKIAPTSRVSSVLLQQFCAQDNKHTNSSALLNQCNPSSNRQGGLNGRHTVNRDNRVGRKRR